MEKCPFCKSENTKYLPSNDAMHKRYLIEKKYGNSTSTETGSFYYPIIKEICMDCGYVFQKMSDENLKKYHEEEKYFVD